MSIKILGGIARGFNLATPNSNLTRPTSVMLKRRLFDSIQSFEGLTFIDICAGSGSVGLEALSRGANHVILIEKNYLNSKIIKENGKSLLQKFDGLGSFEVLHGDFDKFFKKLQAKKDYFLFFDPPYEEVGLYEIFFKHIKKGLFSGRVVVEACEQKTMKISDFEERFGNTTKVFKQGTSYFAIYDI